MVDIYTCVDKLVANFQYFFSLDSAGNKGFYLDRVVVCEGELLHPRLCTLLGGSPQQVTDCFRGSKLGPPLPQFDIPLKGIPSLLDNHRVGMAEASAL